LDLIRFRPNQNLTSPKTFDLLWLCLTQRRCYRKHSPNKKN